MKNFKLLNKKNLLIIITSLSLSISSNAEDRPVDIWNLNKIEIETPVENNKTIETVEKVSESSIYQMQIDKNENSIELDQALLSKEIKIVGLYDPQDYGLSIDMWSNSDGKILKKQVPK